MARRRVWSSLSPGYQARLTRAGITQADYEAGISLKAARGHKETPEHPRDAIKHPEKYRAYRKRAAKLQKEVAEDNQMRFSKHKLQELLMLRKQDMFDRRHKWN